MQCDYGDTHIDINADLKPQCKNVTQSKMKMKLNVTDLG